MIRAAALAALALAGCAHPRLSADVLAALAAPPPTPDGVWLRWLGVAGFELRAPEATIVFDPFLSRPPLARVLFGRVVSDPELVSAAALDPDLVLVGHSHYDHLMDAPAIAARSGATIVGTPTTCHLARALAPGVLCRPASEGPFAVGGATVRALPSRHADTWIGVPLPGTLDRAPAWRHPHAVDLPMGGAVIYVVEVRGLTVVHISSAELPADPGLLVAALPRGADVVLASLASENPRAFLAKLRAQARPRRVIAHHFDDFLAPLDARPPPPDPALGTVELPRPGAWIRLDST